jgi:hypothetical protein
LQMTNNYINMKDLNNTQKAQTEAENKRLNIWQTQQFLRDKVTMNRWCTNVRRSNSFMR